MANLYQLVLTSVLNSDLSNPFVNVFHYMVSDVLPSTAVANALSETFNLGVVQGLTHIVTSNTNFVSIVATAPQAPSVLSITTLTSNGDRLGQAMPRFVTWGFKMPRQRGDMRSGYKRFGACSESDVSGNAPASGVVGELGDVAEEMSAPLSFTVGGVAVGAVPVIVKRIKYTTDEGKIAYRVPGPGDPLTYYEATGWTFQEISTQNSRKR